MKIKDLYDAIPNQEDVDAVLVNALFVRIKNLERMTDMVEDEPIYIEQRSREGDMRQVKNVFWDIYRAEWDGVKAGLSELNLTPRSRKTLAKAMESKGLPKL